MSDYDEAANKIFDYLNKGIDIVHQIILNQEDLEKYYVAYRFSSNEEVANADLTYIKPKVPGAKIIKVNFFEDEKSVIIE